MKTADDRARLVTRAMTALTVAGIAALILLRPWGMPYWALTAVIAVPISMAVTMSITGGIHSRERARQVAEHADQTEGWDVETLRLCSEETNRTWTMDERDITWPEASQWAAATSARPDVVQASVIRYRGGPVTEWTWIDGQLAGTTYPHGNGPDPDDPR